MRLFGQARAIAQELGFTVGHEFVGAAATGISPPRCRPPWTAWAPPATGHMPATNTSAWTAGLTMCGC